MSKQKKYAIVEFLSTKDKGVAQGYTYNNEIGAALYDAVIVPTQYGLSLAVVVQLTDSNDLTFSGSQYHYSKPAIKKIAEVVQSTVVTEAMKARKKADIKKQLEKEVKKLDDIARFKLYAKGNPEFATLLKQYEEM